MGKEYITDSLEVTGTFCDFLGNPGTAGQVVTAAANGGRFDWETPTASTTYLKTRLVDTTLSNISSYSVTACLNTTPLFSNGGISVTNSSNITVTDGGLYKVCTDKGLFFCTKYISSMIPPAILFTKHRFNTGI